MGTWAELRTETLTLLDVDPGATTSSDIRNAVDFSFRHIRDLLINLRPPTQLMAKSGLVTVESTLTSIGITSPDSAPTNPSFVLTDFRKVIALSLEDEVWEYVDYQTWLLSKDASFGDQRWKLSFTIDGSNQIFLNVLPNTGDTWDAYLYYVQEPATIVDGGTPEFQPEWHDLFVLGTVIKFPNRFQTEERLALLAAYTRMYDEKLKLFKQDALVHARDSRLRPRLRNRNSFSTFWG